MTVNEESSKLSRLKQNVSGLVNRARISKDDLNMIVRNSIDDLDATTFQNWYSTLDAKRRVKIDRIKQKLSQLIKDKAKQRTDARIATAGKSPGDLSSEQYEIIYREELDEIKNALKLGAMKGALGVALAALGINVFF